MRHNPYEADPRMVEAMHKAQLAQKPGPSPYEAQIAYAARLRLEAAAPDLLAACKAALAYLREPQDAEEHAFEATAGNITAMEAIAMEIESAIARAEGAETP